MSEWESLGPHQYRVEEDLLFWRPNGEVTSEHAQGVCMLFDKLVERNGYVLWLIDAARSVPVGHDARCVYAAWLAAHPQCNLCVGAFSASIAAHTTASLTVRGVWLLKGIAIPMERFSSEAESRAYLDGHRQALRNAA